MKEKMRLVALTLTLILLAGCTAPIPSPAAQTIVPAAQDAPAQTILLEASDQLTPVPASLAESAAQEPPVATPTSLPDSEPAASQPANSTIDINPLYLVPNNKAAFDMRELMVEDCYLGDSRMDAESVLGKPARVRLTEDEFYYWAEYHYTEGVVLSFSASSMDSSFILRSASVADSSLRGPRGIRVGDTLEKLLSSFMIRDVEMTDEQYERIEWSHDFDEPLLYATVYDVEMMSSRLAENPPYTVVLKPWGFIRTVQDENGEPYLQVVYADVLQYNPFDIQEYMTTEYDTSYLIFDVKKGHVTRFEWYTTIYA